MKLKQYLYLQNEIKTTSRININQSYFYKIEFIKQYAYLFVGKLDQLITLQNKYFI